MVEKQVGSSQERGDGKRKKGRKEGEVNIVTTKLPVTHAYQPMQSYLPPNVYNIQNQIRPMNGRPTKLYRVFTMVLE